MPGTARPVYVEGVQSDPARRGVGEFAGGKEGRKFSVEAVHFKGLGGREEKDVILIWWADREGRRAVPALLNLPVVFRRFNKGFQVFKGFHGVFFEEGGCYPEAEVPEDFWRC